MNVPELTVPSVAITPTLLFLVLFTAYSAAGIKTPNTFLFGYLAGRCSC